MAFEFDPNAMFRACAFYLSKGLVLVRVHGIYQDGRCTCGRSSHVIDVATFEGTPGARKCGKHPVGDDWGERCATTEDQIAEWLDDGIPFNVGCLLGPRGGMIDSEDDTPQAKAFRESIGMDLLETPTWTSGKSTHQLTRWHDSLSVCKGYLQAGGLEVRTGAGDRAIQSILPPSWHWSGVQYKWKPGFSLDDVAIAETPRNLLMAIVNDIDGKTSAPRSSEEPARNILFGVVNDGEGRHRKLLRWAWYKVVNCRKPDSLIVRENTLQELMLLNEANIRPKKTREEVVAIHESCLEHYRRLMLKGWTPGDTDCEEAAIEREVAVLESAATGGSSSQSSSPSVSGFSEQGLEPYKAGKIVAYKPGNWRIEMVHSDPAEIVLCVPAWEHTPCRGRVSLSMDDFRSASKVAAAVFSSTRRVMLDANPSAWKKVWHGQEPSKKNDYTQVPGIAELLVSLKNKEDDVYVGTSSLRFAQLASYVIDVFRKATSPRDEEKPEPNESGRPCWVTPDRLWLKWAKIWEDIERSHDVMPGERNRLRARILSIVGQTDFVHARHQFASGRAEFVVFDREWVAAVEALAAGETSVTETPNTREDEKKIANEAKIRPSDRQLAEV